MRTTTGAIRDQIARGEREAPIRCSLSSLPDKRARQPKRNTTWPYRLRVHIPLLPKMRPSIWSKPTRTPRTAADIFAEEGGQASIERSKRMAREAGLSEAAIHRVIDAMNRANQTPFNPRRVRRELRIAGRSYQPGRQFGGPVTKGKAYTVGEAGPETFVPATSGRIVRHGAGYGAGPVNNITIHAGLGSDPNAIQQSRGGSAPTV